MFFSVIKYYTKTNKNITLKQSETKNSVKKTKIKKLSVFSACPVEKNDRTVVALCENNKNKSRRGVVGSVYSVSPCLCVRIQKWKN